MQVRSALEDKSAGQLSSHGESEPHFGTRYADRTQVIEQRLVRILMLLGSCSLPAVVALILLRGPFSFVSFCTTCGLRKFTTEWQLPGPRIPVFSKSMHQHTPLSELLQTNNIVAVHGHIWSFAQGGGNGVRCALGQGRYLTSLQSSEVASLVEFVHRHRDYAFRDWIVTNALNPSTSEAIRDTAILVSLDTGPLLDESRPLAEIKAMFTNQFSETLSGRRR
jgi:hypothetical protein